MHFVVAIPDVFEAGARPPDLTSELVAAFKEMLSWRLSARYPEHSFAIEDGAGGDGVDVAIEVKAVIQHDDEAPAAIRWVGSIRDTVADILHGRVN